MLEKTLGIQGWRPRDSSGSREAVIETVGFCPLVMQGGQRRLYCLELRAVGVQTGRVQGRGLGVQEPVCLGGWAGRKAFLRCCKINPCFLERMLSHTWQGFPGGSAGEESACQAGDLGWADPLEKEQATHSSTLAWRIPGTVHGVAKSRTQLSNTHTHTHLTDHSTV